jgi:putative thioredoxin
VLTSAGKQQTNYQTIVARFAAAQAASALPPIDQLVRRIHLDRNDLGARLELAELLVSRGDFRPAMHQLIEIVKRDRTFRDDVARKKLLVVFDMAADDPDLVAEYRSRLSSLLF